jgi:hypothetical protein
MAQQVMPFELGTRQRRKLIGTYALTIGGQIQNILIPAIGLAAGFHLKVYGTVTSSASGSFGPQGPWALLNRIQVNVNLGTALLYDTSGFGNYVIQPWLDSGFFPDNAGGGSTTPDATNVYAAPLSGTAQALLLHYYVPLALNQGADLSKGGLINLQSPETQMYLNITTGQLADYSTTVTSFPSLTLEVDYDYFEVPPQPTYAMPKLNLSRILQQTTAFSAVGDQLAVIPRMGVLFRYADMMTANGARNDCLTQTRMVFNQTDYVYQEDANWLKERFRAQNGLNNPTGVYYHDMWDAVYPGMGFGSLRDAVNTQLFAELDAYATVASGTTLGAGNNFRDLIRHIGQPLYVTGQAGS